MERIMPVCRTNDIEIYFERAGAGPTLLFIGGTGGDLRVKPNVFDGPLPRQFDVIAYDQRGLGRTSKPDRSYTMAQYADDAAALLSALAVSRAVVFGVSFGGMVAQELALRHPGRVKAMVLACTSPGGEGGASYPLHQLTGMTREEMARTMIPISDTRRDAAWAAANPEEHRALVEMASTDPYAEESDRAMGARRQLEARATHDTWDRLAAIRCPVLVAGGKFDGIATPETQARMAARIPGAQLRMYEGGHLFLLQDRAAFPEIAAFLKSNS
jgi:3-oxoadipate enol-lactonase